MALDGAVIRALKYELSEKLVDGRIDKVYQPERDEIVISVRKYGEHYKLLLCANPSFPRVHLTSYTKDNPATPPLFCMLLRKHLCGGKITNINQLDLERVISFEIEAYDELGDLSTKTLICEIMGKHSNIILIDANKKIIDSIFHIDITISSVRQVIPGLIYENAPSQGKKNPLEVSFEEFLSDIRSINGDYVKKIMTAYMGVSPLLAREIVFNAFKNVDAVESEENDKQVAESFFEIFLKISQNSFYPVIICDNESGKMLEFSSYDVNQYENMAHKETFESISEAIETFYIKKATKESVKQKTNDILKVVTNNIARCHKKLQIECEILEKCKKRELHKVKGDLITANIYRIEKGAKSVVLENYYDNNKPIEILLKENLTPSQNAQNYYKKYNKEKIAEIETTKQKEMNELEIDYLESVLQFLENVETKEEIAQIKEELTEQGYLKKRNIKGRKKEAVSKPMEFLSSDGFEIFVGKNNKQNDYVTLKLARSTDIWLHTKAIHGSHAIIKTGGEENIPDTTILEAANIAAYYSKGKNSSNVSVDYTFVKNVKKPSGAKPGMVIYVNNKTAVVTPDEKLVLSLKKHSL
ncbi:MAG: fibronectin/fibrinogen-binding protein [Ruminococcaceae bacterium]|nr:fibronectin/fibrinogen-binding protein [Oscillospiraceae bacterium]